MGNRLMGCLSTAFFAPVLLGISLLLLISQGRPIFFPQVRIGLRKKPFRCLKFRTMENGLVTPIGKWLRSTGLDELPQLLNIALGEMNAVGPRPITKSDSIRFGYEDTNTNRWDRPPGLTGLAQFVGTRSADDALELDEWYIANRSFGLDCRLVVATLVANIFGKKKAREVFKTDVTLYLKRA
jgi:lipopolysaccharide/colanic/teichoic acid biosynthesis glycosyltransferase